MNRRVKFILLVFLSFPSFLATHPGFIWSFFSPLRWPLFLVSLSSSLNEIGGNVSARIVLIRISRWEGQWRLSNGYHHDCLCWIKLMEKTIWKASWFQSELTFQQSWRTYWSKYTLCLKRRQIWLQCIRFPLHSISLFSLLFPHFFWSLDGKQYFRGN